MAFKFGYTIDRQPIKHKTSDFYLENSECNELTALRLHHDALINHDNWYCQNTTNAFLSKETLKKSLETMLEIELRPDEHKNRCSVGKHYVVSTSNGNIILTVEQAFNFLHCFDTLEQKLIFRNFADDEPEFVMEHADFSGFLSTKLTFQISKYCGNELGLITKKTGFLECPVFEVLDTRGELIFMVKLNWEHVGNLNENPLTITNCKYEKVGVLIRSGTCWKAYFHVPYGVFEKILLLSLMVLLDLVGN